jgi:hypothetical protein
MGAAPLTKIRIRFDHRSRPKQAKSHVIAAYRAFREHVARNHCGFVIGPVV